MKTKEKILDEITDLILVEVGKEIFIEKNGILFYRFQNPDELKQKLGIK